eukprot:4275121-Lingulodinium_polyedra.AAC.1
MTQLQHAAHGRKRDNIARASGLKLACVHCVGDYHKKEYINDANQYQNGWRKRRNTARAICRPRRSLPASSRPPRGTPTRWSRCWKPTAASRT